MSYDQKCAELAEHFLYDEPCRDNPVLYRSHIDSLTEAIQSAVAEWFMFDMEKLQ